MKIIKMIVMVMMMVMVLTSFGFAGDVDRTDGYLYEVTCKKRLIDGNDEIEVFRVNDPDNPFISIFFTKIDSGKVFAISNPSDTSIAVRLTGKITKIDKRTAEVRAMKQSWFTKEMKISRYYDAGSNSLVYLIYSTKMLNGSFKHNISVVHLGH